MVEYSLFEVIRDSGVKGFVFASKHVYVPHVFWEDKELFRMYTSALDILNFCTSFEI